LQGITNYIHAGVSKLNSEQYHKPSDEKEDALKDIEKQESDTK